MRRRGRLAAPVPSRNPVRLFLRLCFCCLSLLVITSCRGQPEPPQRPLDPSSLALRWTFDSGSPINQTPLRVGDALVFVPAGGPLVALEADTGKLRWQFAPPEGVWERSLATDGRTVFAGTGGGGLVALEADSGEVRWKRDLGIEVQLPPLVRAEVLYIPSTFVGPGLAADYDGRAKIFVLASATGKPRWSFETDNYILQTPELRGEDLYVAGNYYAREPIEQGGHMRMYALHAADGSLRWTYESGDGFPKRLYAGDSTVTYIGYRDFVSGVDADGGALRWRRNTGNWVPSLTGEADVIYFGSANTVVHALEAGSGEVVWQHNIEHGTFNYVLGAPVLVEGELYFLTQHGDIMALDALDGDLLWEFPTGITSRVGMHLSQGWIYIGDEKGVVRAYSDDVD